ncbi:Similar to conserved hypothetical protein [Aspergillus flavus NRRL3357]; acc. no. XP_002372296, partial [Pyronema omphalodes CBS 100304]
MDKVTNAAANAAESVRHALWGEGTTRDETLAGTDSAQRVGTGSRFAGDVSSDYAHDGTSGKFNHNTTASPMKFTGGSSSLDTTGGFSGLAGVHDPTKPGLTGGRDDISATGFTPTTSTTHLNDNSSILPGPFNNVPANTTTTNNPFRGERTEIFPTNTASTTNPLDDQTRGGFRNTTTTGTTDILHDHNDGGLMPTTHKLPSTAAGAHTSNLSNQADHTTDFPRAGGYNHDHGVTGASSFAPLGTKTTAGPHSSDTANKLDPRVDSDLDGRSRISGGTFGSHTNTTGTKTTAEPHNSDLLNKLDPRVDSNVDSSKSTASNTAIFGGHAGKTTTGLHDSDLLNKLDPRVDSDRDGRSGMTGSHTTGTTGGMFGGHKTTSSNKTTSGPHNSDLLNKLDPRVDSDRDGRSGINTNTSRDRHHDHDGTIISAPLGDSEHNHKYHDTTTTPIGTFAHTHNTHENTTLNAGHTGTFGSGTGLDSTTRSTTTAGLAGASSTTTNGPHQSNLANKMDPRVDSDHDHRGTTTAALGGGHTTGLANAPSTGLSHPDTTDRNISNTHTGPLGTSTSGMNTSNTGIGSSNRNANTVGTSHHNTEARNTDSHSSSNDPIINELHAVNAPPGPTYTEVSVSNAPAPFNTGFQTPGNADHPAASPGLTEGLTGNSGNDTSAHKSAVPGGNTFKHPMHNDGPSTLTGGAHGGPGAQAVPSVGASVHGEDMAHKHHGQGSNAPLRDPLNESSGSGIGRGNRTGDMQHSDGIDVRDSSRHSGIGGRNTNLNDRHDGIDMRDNSRHTGIGGNNTNLGGANNNRHAGIDVRDNNRHDGLGMGHNDSGIDGDRMGHRKSIPLVEGHPESDGPTTHPSGEKLPSAPGTGEGKGHKIVHATGVAADGGDFDASLPGAGREAEYVPLPLSPPPLHLRHPYKPEHPYTLHYPHPPPP